MSLVLYQTNIKPEQNAFYEDIGQYLETCSFATFPDFQYIKPGLAAYIKVPMQGYSRNTPYNYAKITQKGVTYYYYVTNHRWVAEETLGLTLALDTVNTFWYDLEPTITNNTHITRRFKNRFNKIEASTTFLYPKIDRFAEDISNPTLIRKSVTKVGDEHLWYLISKTDYLASNSNLAANPVSTYVLKDEGMVTEGTEVLAITPELISADACAYVIPMSGDSSKITFVGSTYVKQLEIAIGNDYDFCYWYYHNGSITLKLHLKEKFDGETAVADTYAGVTKIVLNNVRTVYKQSDSWNNYDSNNGLMNRNYTIDNPIAYNSIEGGTTIPSFQTWYKNNKTDGTLIKIVCLPYQPFDFKNWEEGIDYIGTPAGFKILNPNIRFNDTSIVDRAIQLDKIPMSTACKPETAYDLKYESKRYNSAYYSLKYVYDNNYLAYSLEDFGNDFVNLSIDIKFIYNNEMSNSLAFQFSDNNGYRYDTDYGEYMICNKTLDVPFYTNEYLNYLRYGKAVDERNAGFSTASSIIGGVSTTASSVGTIMALASSTTMGGPIGWAVGLAGAASTLVSFASTLAKTRDSINQKIDSYAHQASSVNGSSDISVFKEYSGNKLLRIEYQAPDELLTPILEYFRKFGYATDEYGYLDINTRYYSDFIQAELDLEGNYNVDTDYVDDFKSRFKSGLRIYHLHDGTYDFTMQYENWEVDYVNE